MRKRVKIAFSGGLLLYGLLSFMPIAVTEINYRGAGPGCNTQEIGEKLAQLRNEVASLDTLERNLDQHKQVLVFHFYWKAVILTSVFVSGYSKVLEIRVKIMSIVD